VSENLQNASYRTSCYVGLSAWQPPIFQ